jgi:hypothetical protein
MSKLKIKDLAGSGKISKKDMKKVRGGTGAQLQSIGFLKYSGVGSATGLGVGDMHKIKGET